MPQEFPLIYVIVLTWNGREHTLECLRSVRESDYPNYKILLVDNASTDNTVDVVKKEFPDIEVIENRSNLGYAGGNNVGIAYAMERGAQFFFILNNDTVVDRSAIRILVTAASENENAFICTPAIYKYFSPQKLTFCVNFWDSTAFRFRWAESFHGSSSLPATGKVSTAFAPGCSLFFSLAVLKKVGLFDSRFFLYWEDTDWGFRAMREGCQSFVVPEAKIWHKESQTFTDPSRRPAYHYYYFRNRLLWIEKNFYGKNVWRGMLWALRELIKPLHPWHKSEESEGRLPVFRARLLAALHYSTRRFGAL